MPGVSSTPAKEKRQGTVTLTVVELNKTVTFDRPMPSMAYDLSFYAPGLSLGISGVTKTVNGFSIALSLGLGGSIQWWAIEQ